MLDSDNFSFKNEYRVLNPSMNLSNVKVMTIDNSLHNTNMQNTANASIQMPNQKEVDL